MRKVIEKLVDEKSGGVPLEFEDEINNLYQKKREQAARIEQAMERISDLEKDLYDNQEALNRTRLGDRDIVALRNDLTNKVEDLKLRQDQDLAQTNNRLMKRIDDLQGALEQLDKAMDDIEHRRLTGESNILKKSMQILKEGNIEGELLDHRRRLKDLENEILRPREVVKRVDIEKEEIIKEMVQGMASFERDMNDVKKQLSEHDKDIQDAAKLIQILDQEKTKDRERMENLRLQIADLVRVYDVVKKDKVLINQNVEDLRLACESEFNHVKKAEITDFKNLNNRMNELTNLQDIVEQLADQLEYTKKQIDGVRHERNHTPVRLQGKVGAENLTSSMTPSTMLFSDLKNRKNIHPDDLDRATIKNLSLDYSNHSPMTSKVRDSLFTRSRLSKYLADKVDARDRDYLEINDRNYHRDDELPAHLYGNDVKDKYGRPESGKVHNYKPK